MFAFVTSAVATSTLILLIGCYASFIWVIKCFFRIPAEGMPLWMRITGGAGLISMILQVIGATIYRSEHLIRLSVGIALMSCSMLLFWWTILVTWRTKLAIAFGGEQSDFVKTSGPFGIVRHPIYLSYMLCWIGGAIVSNWPLTWCVPPAMFVLYWSAARAEELAFLSSSVQLQYREYARRTGQFVPVRTLFCDLSRAVRRFQMSKEASKEDKADSYSKR